MAVVHWRNNHNMMKHLQVMIIEKGFGKKDEFERLLTERAIYLQHTQKLQSLRTR